MHIALILWLGFNFFVFEKEKNVTLSSAERTALQAYVYSVEQPKVVRQHPPQMAVKKIQPAALQDKIEHKRCQGTTCASANTSADTSSQQSQGLKGEEPIDKFLAILHDTIQAHQRYPKQAQIMQRKGTALVKFTLFPDGHMENVILIKSSQTESLDEAALLAVNEAAPITEAAVYLKDKKSFTVHVDFQ